MRVRGPLILLRGPSPVVRTVGPTAAILLGWLLVSAPLLHAAGGPNALGTPPPSAAAPFSGTEDRAEVLISRVYASAARDDEFVELENVHAAPVDLSGWSLSDGEANVSFPLDVVVPPGGRIVVTRNSTSYAEDVLAPADFTWERGDARRMEGGVLRLADAGDEVLLADEQGGLVDALAYGDSLYSGPGWEGPAARGTGRGELAVRARDSSGFLVDVGDAADWDGRRTYRLGQSELDIESIESDGPATAVVSPDLGDGPLLAFLSSASASVEVGVYTLTSERIAAVLADAAGRGVAVRILLEGAPVGGIEPEERQLVGALQAAGAGVRFLAGGEDLVKRYRYLHAKYAIVDDAAAWIGSENFGEAGFPPDGGPGNRGWSVVIEDPVVARSLRSVFDLDFDPRRRDSRPADEPPAPLAPPPPIAPWRPLPSGMNRVVRLLVGPDMSLGPGGLLDVLTSARERVWIQALYIDTEWDRGPNPFLEAAFDAALRGVSVRILLDGSWWSTPDDAEGNDERAAAINRRARDLGVDLEARLLEPSDRIERLHNKGLVVDGRIAFVSSMNWGEASATENREVGVVLEDPALTAAFEAAFREDWGEASAPEAGFIDDPVVLLLIYAFVAAASAASLRKLRVERKGIKPGSRVERRGPARADLRRRPREVRLLPAELVAEPRPGTGGRPRTRGGGTEARGRDGGPERD